MRVVIEVEIRNMTHPTTKVKDGHDIQYLTYAFKKCTLNDQHISTIWITGSEISSHKIRSFSMVSAPILIILDALQSWKCPYPRSMCFVCIFV